MKVFWLVLNYSTGEVVGNRYISNLADIIGSTNVANFDDYAYIINNGNSFASYISKYDKTKDEIVTTLKHTSIFSNIVKTKTAFLFTGRFLSNLCMTIESKYGK